MSIRVNRNVVEMLYSNREIGIIRKKVKYK